MNFHPFYYYGALLFAFGLIEVATLVRLVIFYILPLPSRIYNFDCLFLTLQRQYGVSLLTNLNSPLTRSVVSGCLAYIPKDPNDEAIPAKFIFVEEKYPYYTEIKGTIISAGENTRGLKKVNNLINSCDTMVEGMSKFLLSEITSCLTFGHQKYVQIEYKNVKVVIIFSNPNDCTDFVEILSETKITCQDP